jgi:cytochrome c peroxidase
MLIAVLATLCNAAASEVPDTALRHRIELGAKLFSDSSLSADQSVSCASCHQREHAFSDTKRVSRGVFSRQGTRNAPSLLDASLRSSLFWDGRRSRTVDLVLDPLMAHMEQGLGGESDLLGRVEQSRDLSEAYYRAFGRSSMPSARNIAIAIADYLDTLRVGNTPLQRHIAEESTNALSHQQRLGYEIFRGRAGCANCHLANDSGIPLTDDLFHNRAVGEGQLKSGFGASVSRALKVDSSQIGELIMTDPEVSALGRFVVTRQAADIGAFRTPPLFNVALTAPYMHDGSIPTLNEAVDHEIYYSTPDHGAGLDQEEREALVAFLHALTSER